MPIFFCHLFWLCEYSLILALQITPLFWDPFLIAHCHDLWLITSPSLLLTIFSNWQAHLRPESFRANIYVFVLILLFRIIMVCYRKIKHSPSLPHNFCSSSLKQANPYYPISSIFSIMTRNSSSQICQAAKVNDLWMVTHPSYLLMLKSLLTSCQCLYRKKCILVVFLLRGHLSLAPHLLI